MSQDIRGGIPVNNCSELQSKSQICCVGLGCLGFRAGNGDYERASLDGLGLDLRCSV